MAALSATTSVARTGRIMKRSHTAVEVMLRRPQRNHDRARTRNCLSNILSKRCAVTLSLARGVYSARGRPARLCAMSTQHALEDLTGAALIGLVFSAILYGVTCLQVYSYYVDYGRADRVFLKSLVTAVMILDTVHLGLVMHTVYWYTVIQYGNFHSLDSLVWSLIIQIGVGYLLAAMVQSYYAWRIYIVSFQKNRWLPLLIFLVALGAVASAFAFIVYTFRIPPFTTDDPYAVPLAASAFGLELVADVLIMLGTIFYLRKSRREPSLGFRSNWAIAKLITYAAKTGIPINVFTVLTITVFVAHQNDLLYTPFFFVLVRLYSCSFMTILNSRKTVRAAMNAQNRASSDLGPGSAIPLGSLCGSGGAGAVSRIRFRVDAETVVSDDTAVSDSSRSKDRKA